MDRLLREGNPPAGQLASPKPQYKKPGVDEYAPVEGQHGAPFAILKDASGNVVSPATDAKLEQVKSELELVKSELQTIKANQLSGDQKVQLSGTKVEVETVLNALSIAPGTTQKFTLNQGDADEVWFLVSADKPGWELLGGVAYSKSVSQGNRLIFYPKGTTGGTGSHYIPKRFLVLGCMSPLEDPTTYLEARAMMTPVAADTEFGVYVRPTEEITTITLRVLKIWRR